MKEERGQKKEVREKMMEERKKKKAERGDN